MDGGRAAGVWPPTERGRVTCARQKASSSPRRRGRAYKISSKKLKAPATTRLAYAPARADRMAFIQFIDREDGWPSRARNSRHRGVRGEGAVSRQRGPAL